MPTPVGFAEIAIEYRHVNDPEPWYNIFGVETDLATHTAQEHLDHAAAVWYANWQPRLSESVTLTNAIGRFGQDGGGDLILETSVAPLVGTSDAAMLPQNCAALIRKQTSLGGRQGRGRFFIPNVLAETAVTDTGFMSDAMRAQLTTAANETLLDLAAADPVSGAMTPMVLLHGPKKSTGLTPPPTPVDTLVVESLISTQRRRLRK